MKTNRTRPICRRGGFTLIEILVVLAIAAFVTAITVGGVRELSTGNKRVSCQTNLVQIYQAARLYAADEGGGFPFYNPASSGSQPAANIGLWGLYTFSTGSAPPDVNTIAPPALGKPVMRYLRNEKSLHCPFDYTHSALFDATKTNYNSSYCSYQGMDDSGDPANAGAQPTYSSVRTQSSNDPNWTRQLLEYTDSNLTRGSQVRRPPSDKTVVLWCPWHRPNGPNRGNLGGGRDMDNVLFYDGTVQMLPRAQDDPDHPGTTLYGWRRKPRPQT